MIHDLGIVLQMMTVQHAGIYSSLLPICWFENLAIIDKGWLIHKVMIPVGNYFVEGNLFMC
jgi:hypothetical protein